MLAGRPFHGRRADRVPGPAGGASGRNATAVERIARASTSAGYSLAFVVGGALIIAGSRAGLYWIAAGAIACVIAVVFNAWVLMIEILR